MLQRRDCFAGLYVTSLVLLILALVAVSRVATSKYQFEALLQHTPINFHISIMMSEKSDKDNIGLPRIGYHRVEMEKREAGLYIRVAIGQTLTG
jgi:hypothetical protein